MKTLTRLILSLALLAVFVVPATGKLQQSGPADDLMRSAAALYLERRYDEALVSCLKAIELTPNDYRPRALAGSIYAAQRKLKNASESFAEAIRLQPRERKLYLAKAEVDMLRNARPEAIASARKATEVDPNYAEAYLMLGELLQVDEERRTEAIDALRTAIKLNPKLLRSYAVLGGILADAKDDKGAEEVLRQGMAADPKRMSGRFVLGRMLVRQGRLAEARKLWDERTSDKDNSFPQFIQLLQRAENLKSATEELAAKPDDPKALVAMGLAVMDGDHWVVDGRQKRALAYFQKALQLKPDYARAQYGICRAYIEGVEFAKDESKMVDQELAKLRQLDPALATELDDYRKNYVKGLRATPPNP